MSDFGFYGYNIMYEVGTSTIEISSGNTVSEKICSKDNKRRFRKVLRKIAKGICPVCKKDSDVGWIEDETGVKTTLYLYHHEYAGRNICGASIEVKDIWVRYVYNPTEIGIQNKAGNKKLFQKFVQKAAVVRDKSAVMLYGKTIRCSNLSS